MAVEAAPPKYGQIVNALEERITSGVYPAGSQLPSEAAFGVEFGASRTTVVRALAMLRQDGWIESQHGRGYFVRGRPAGAGQVRPGQVFLEGAESEPRTRLLGAGVGRPPARVAEALGLADTGQAVYRRQVTVERDGTRVELVTMWFPVEVAAGTLLESAEPIREGFREHLRARKRLRVDHLIQRTTARFPNAEEAKALDMSRRTPVLGVVVIGCDSAGDVVQVADSVLPGDRQELEDIYRVS